MGNTLINFLQRVKMKYIILGSIVGLSFGIYIVQTVSLKKLRKPVTLLSMAGAAFILSIAACAIAHFFGF